MDGLPAVFLIGILPCAGEGGEVLGEVDEESDEAEPGQQGHAQGEVFRLEMDLRFPESDGTGNDQRPSDIRDVVMCEEIRVGEDGDGSGDPQGRESGEAEMESPPRARHVGADGRIHESGEQRHGRDAKEGALGIRPRADLGGGFEKLHASGHDMKEEDDAELTP